MNGGIMLTLTWNNSQSLIKPKTLDKDSSPHGVYIRRFINESINDDGQTVYNYQEAFLSLDEYNKYELILAISGEEDTEEYLEYKMKLDTPVLYEKNGHMYKPKWAAEIYEKLVSRGENFAELFPITIWDATGNSDNAVEMSLEDLKELTIFLGRIQEQYFNEYKVANNYAIINS